MIYGESPSQVASCDDYMQPMVSAVGSLPMNARFKGVLTG